ncbi:MAG: hypothetical protein LBD20_05225 [Spirochaetaceae bacterium]|jgi:hypothetical protein|nr:hypothetical protein [Spirochaetaceae bacterium]
MKKKYFFLGLLILTAALCLVISGCDDLFTNEATFKNASSYIVDVSMDGENFKLQKGDSKSVKYKGSSFSFLYSPANNVTAQQSGDTITFKNL